MNNSIATFARNAIKQHLALLPTDCQDLFRLMYAEPTEPRRRTPDVVAKIKAACIEDVVDGMPDFKLDWALSQVEATLKERGVAQGEA